MNTRFIFLIAKYEMRILSREWTFRFFILFSIIGITALHVYWQGQGNVQNWKMVALPCTIPLMNAYLFCIIQSLFLPFSITAIPGRITHPGMMDCLSVHPRSNKEFLYGMLLGNFFLFEITNVFIILSTIFIVHLTSLAPLNLWYYLFYMLTLNIPCWIFVAALSLWTSMVTRSRGIGIILALVWWIGCLTILPYSFHGILDFTATGVPNLFSGMVGHVNLSGYLVHRTLYFLLGTGLLAWCLSMLNRLPNKPQELSRWKSIGILVVLSGIACGACIENNFRKTRTARQEWKACFERNWQEKTCRVKRHAISLQQEQDILNLKSSMLLVNPGQEKLQRIILFLNPGLNVTYLRNGEENIPFLREGQSIIINKPLAAGDSLNVEMGYNGQIDTRFCDLHLPDKEFEDVFGGDNFFPAGRKGAFVEKDLLLLTPACAWYPTAFPPVNPVNTLYSQRDFTLFRLEIMHPKQRNIFSEGIPRDSRDGKLFTCSKPLNGITVYAANNQFYSQPMEPPLGFHFYVSKNFGESVANLFKHVHQSRFEHVFDRFYNTISGGVGPTIFHYDGFTAYRDQDWCEKDFPYLSFGEVPLSYRIDSHGGKPECAMAEPGIIFFRERGFDLDIAKTMQAGVIKDKEEFNKATSSFDANLFEGKYYDKYSHPLSFAASKNHKNYKRSWQREGKGETLWEGKSIWVHDDSLPLMGKIFELMKSETSKEHSDFLHNNVRFTNADAKKRHDLLTGHNLPQLLASKDLDENTKTDVFRLKLMDLLMRMTVHIPKRELQDELERLYKCSGEIKLDQIIQAWDEKWDMDTREILQEWITAKHGQHFKMRNVSSCFDMKNGLLKIEGIIKNAGKESGIVSLIYSNGDKLGYYQEYYNCLLLPGETKRFNFVIEHDMKVFYNNSARFEGIYLGLSSNRPTYYYTPREISNPEESASWDRNNGWFPDSGDVFKPQDNTWVIDDSDPGFEIENGNQTLLQKWFPVPAKEIHFPLTFRNPPTSWATALESSAIGDSICGFHCIQAGDGKSKARWKVQLPEAGKYKLSIYAHAASPEPLSENIWYYYTIRHKKGEEKAEIELILKNRSQFHISVETLSWIPVGVFECPKGEITVELSNKDIDNRKEVIIVADAIKWEKIKE